MTPSNTSLKTKAQPCRPEDSGPHGWPFQFLWVQDQRKEDPPSFQERAATLPIEVISIPGQLNIQELLDGEKIAIVRFLRHGPELQVYDLKHIVDARVFVWHELKLALSKGGNILLPIWLRDEGLRLADGGYLGSFRFSVAEEVHEFLSCRWLKMARRELLGRAKS